ncbi:hypothetical protein ACIQXV_03635 [Neobacillus sp. NPDC097160]|uniref:hypothetical protein n=1 Tax=Neobacillus sp. NPDC097160 TaxID=3364298 RepID=UPI003812AC39
MGLPSDVSAYDPSDESDNDPADDNKEGTPFHKVGTRIPYGFRKKNMENIFDLPTS